MKIDNTTKIIKSQILAEEIKQIASNVDIEPKEIVEFCQNENAIEELIQRFSNNERVDDMMNFMENLDAETGRNRLIKCVEKKRVERVFKRRFRFVSSIAAAAIIAISFMLYFGRQSHFSSQVAELEKPEILVPTLETASGVINLLKIEDNIVEESGHSVVKNSMGKLSYSTKKTVEVAPEVTYNLLTIPSNFNYSLGLSDGTVVLLNACSKIKYPTIFSGDSREVELVGEGYFKVTKSDKPFIVKTGSMNVKVYGTEFNVKAYEKGDKQAILVNGKIGVSSGSSEELMLLPNQIATCGSDDLINIQSVDALEYIKWIENKFKYIDTPMSVVLEDLSRWYGIEFVTKLDLTNSKLSFFSYRDSDIYQVLSLIQKVSDVKFIKEGGKLYSIER